MESGQQIQMKCAELEQALAAQNPGYVGILQTIHENVREQPELLHMLKDEEIAVIVKGLETWTGKEITVAKSKGTISKKKAAGMSADDV